jgi:hypothetical protein
MYNVQPLTVVVHVLTPELCWQQSCYLLWWRQSSVNTRVACWHQSCGTCVDTRVVLHQSCVDTSVVLHVVLTPELCYFPATRASCCLRRPSPSSRQNMRERRRESTPFRGLTTRVTREKTTKPHALSPAGDSAMRILAVLFRYFWE